MINQPEVGEKPFTESGSNSSPQGMFALDSQLDGIGELSEHFARKHWTRAEREQYPFWIGILLIAIMGIGGMYIRHVQWIGLLIATIMLVGLVVLVGVYLRNIQGRFGRIWDAMASDGEMFRQLHEVGMILGYPVEMGKPDEMFSTQLDRGFPETVNVVENYLKSTSLPGRVPLDAPPGFRVPASTLTNPAGGGAHRVYEIEYRGTVNMQLSIRVSRIDRGTDIVIGFPPVQSGAETRDRLTSSLQGKLRERYIAFKILGDIRAWAGVPAIPLPVTKPETFGANRHMSRAI
jgi:hypothetical protein